MAIIFTGSSNTTQSATADNDTIITAEFSLVATSGAGIGLGTFNGVAF